MSRYAPKTLRRMPATTREIARLANELASVQTRLSNRIGGLASMEMMAGASQRVFCNNDTHANVVNAALRYVKAIDDPELQPGRKDRRADGAPGCGSALRPRQAIRRAGAGASRLRAQLDAPRRSARLQRAGRTGPLPSTGAAPPSFQSSAARPRYFT